MCAQTSKNRSTPEAEHLRYVRTVAREVAAVLGADFFRSLATYLAATLRADCVYVAELVHSPIDKAQTIALCRDGVLEDNSSLDLPGSAAAQVLIDGVVAWSTNVTEIFPLDSSLQRMEADGFVGIRLIDSLGSPQGLIAVISRRRLTDVKSVKSVLQAFAPRAAAELERKRSDDALRQGDERHRAFIATNMDGMWRIEFERPIPVDIGEEEQVKAIYEGYLAECNPALARMLGAQSVEELVGLRFKQLVDRLGPEVQDEVRAIVRSGYRFATVEAAPREGRTGKEYRLRSEFGIVENNELRRIWGTTRDITDLKKAELPLQASEQRFPQVLESIELMAVTTDATGRVVFCNDYLVRELRLTKDRLTGTDWLELIDSPEEKRRWKALLTGASSVTSSDLHFEGSFPSIGATRRLIAWDTVVLRDDQSNPVGLAGFGRDITRQRALELQSRQTEKFHSVGRLAGGLAHDFNNLLTIIIGQSGRVLGRLNKSDSSYQALAAIKTAGETCAALTGKLLAIAARQVLKPELLDINALIAGEETVVRTLLGEPVALIMHLEPSLGNICADPVQLRQVLANLATNARDAMPAGGRVMIATANAEFVERAPRAPAGVPPGRYVRITFSDSGVGMTDEVRDRMFDPFFTTKSSGQGLGLATVYGIVTQSGGSLSVRTKPAAGTTFEIFLPRVDPTDVK